MFFGWVSVVVFLAIVVGVFLIGTVGGSIGRRQDAHAAHEAPEALGA